jgi:hypothetical protein
MIKPALLAAAAVSMFGSAAMADVYVNTEFNGSAVGQDWKGSTTELHIGWKGNPSENSEVFAQVGPAFTSTDGASGSVDTDVSGKLGGTVALSDKFDLYGEVSFITDETEDTAYGTKVGGTYTF